jgi:hypothetical protein
MAVWMRIVGVELRALSALLKDVGLSEFDIAP